MTRPEEPQRQDPSSRSEPPRRILPAAIVHQEGILGVLALVGLGLRDGTPLPGLLPRGALAPSLLAGLIGGALAAAGMWLLGRVPAIRELERWQREMVRGWGLSEVGGIALLSGLAEEGLVRALFQPTVGLVPAALIFAVLHLVPDRRAWVWPVLAFALGIGLGILFERWGYPAAATAHAVINLTGFLRLRSTSNS